MNSAHRWKRKQFIIFKLRYHSPSPPFYSRRWIYLTAFTHIDFFSPVTRKGWMKSLQGWAQLHKRLDLFRTSWRLFYWPKEDYISIPLLHLVLFAVTDSINGKCKAYKDGRHTYLFFLLIITGMWVCITTFFVILLLLLLYQRSSYLHLLLIHRQGKHTRFSKWQNPVLPGFLWPTQVVCCSVSGYGSSLTDPSLAHHYLTHSYPLAKSPCSVPFYL